MISILHVDLKIPAEVDKSEKKVEEEEEKFVMKLKFYRKKCVHIVFVLARCEAR